MKNSTSAGIGGIIGVIVGAGASIAYNKIKSSKEEKIESSEDNLDESVVEDGSDEDPEENQEG